MIKVWDISSDTCLNTLEGHDRAINSVAFSSDGTRGVSGSEDQTVKIWDATGRLKTLKGHRESVFSAAFSSNGMRVVSGSDDNTVKIWDINSCTCVRTLQGHIKYVNSVAFSLDSTPVASASCDNTVRRIWDANSGLRLATIESQVIEDISFDATGSYLLTDIRTISWNIVRRTALSADARETAQYHGYGLSADRAWRPKITIAVLAILPVRPRVALTST
jgi:WD40 repeat protein